MRCWSRRARASCPSLRALTNACVAVSCFSWRAPLHPDPVPHIDKSAAPTLPVPHSWASERFGVPLLVVGLLLMHTLYAGAGLCIAHLLPDAALHYALIRRAGSCAAVTLPQLLHAWQRGTHDRRRHAGPARGAPSVMRNSVLV